MKKRSLTLLLTVATFMGAFSCTSDNFALTEFDYHNDDVAISDTQGTATEPRAHVVLLYGQSNAEGVAYNSYLGKNAPAKYAEYETGYENAYICFQNDKTGNSSGGAFAPLSLGCGWSSDTFGPEVGIAEKMHEAYPTQPVFIIKWTFGGTTLHDQWLDGARGRGDLYNCAMDFTRKCLDYLIGKGYTELSIDGICWMQGENDACFKYFKQYENDTSALVSYLRYDLAKYQSEIKWIDAGINEQPGIWNSPDKINKAKKSFANRDKNNFYLDPTAMGLSSTAEPEEGVDFAHFDSLSMVKLGQEFGKICAQK